MTMPRPPRRSKHPPAPFFHELLREKPRKGLQGTRPPCAARNCAEKCGPLRGKKERARRTRAAGSVDKDAGWGAFRGGFEPPRGEFQELCSPRLLLNTISNQDLPTPVARSDSNAKFLKLSSFTLLHTEFSRTRRRNGTGRDPCLRTTNEQHRGINPRGFPHLLRSTSPCLASSSIVEPPSSRVERRERENCRSRASQEKVPGLARPFDITAD